MSIDIAINGQQIAYITIHNIKGTEGLCEYEVRLMDSEHPRSAKAVKTTHYREQSYLTLLRKVFTKLEESSNK